MTSSKSSQWNRSTTFSADLVSHAWFGITNHIEGESYHHWNSMILGILQHKRPLSRAFCIQLHACGARVNARSYVTNGPQRLEPRCLPGMTNAAIGCLAWSMELQDNYMRRVCWGLRPRGQWKGVRSRSTSIHGCYMVLWHACAGRTPANRLPNPFAHLIPSVLMMLMMFNYDDD